MTVVNVVVFVAGFAIVATTLRSAVRTFLVPRALQAHLSRAVFVSVRRIFWLRANHRHSYEQRDRVMAFYAPIGLLTLLITWLVLVTAGFTGMFWALGAEGWRTAFILSGSSLYTLGFASGGDLASIVLSFSEAGIGLMLLALLITYLPSLYAAFSRREAGVCRAYPEEPRGLPSGGLLAVLGAGHGRQGHEEGLPPGKPALPEG